MGSNLSERDKNEGALGKARMRDFEAVLADVSVIEHQNVEVERARAVGDAGRAVAPELVFDGEQGLQQIVRSELCF
jgi:CO/xanthine dehydrogenase Mo-binding subunit